MPLSKRRPHGILYLVFGATLGLFAWTGLRSAQAAAKPVASLTLKNAQGKTEKIDLRAPGKTNLIVYWATWCAPCRAEVPDLNRIQQKYKSRGLTIRAISADDEGLAVVKPFLKKVKMSYPVYLINHEAATAFGDVEGLPSSFLVDSNGRVVKSYLGRVNPKELNRDLERTLAKTRASKTQAKRVGAGH
jgi:thiol-disulfide isomerase/thioredoxin